MSGSGFATLGTRETQATLATNGSIFTARESRENGTVHLPVSLHLAASGPRSPRREVRR